MTKLLHQNENRGLITITTKETTPQDTLALNFSQLGLEFAARSA